MDKVTEIYGFIGYLDKDFANIKAKSKKPPLIKKTMAAIKKNVLLDRLVGTDRNT